jgi:hypothetical protein
MGLSPRSFHSGNNFFQFSVQYHCSVAKPRPILHVYPVPGHGLRKHARIIRWVKGWGVRTTPRQISMYVIKLCIYVTIIVNIGCKLAWQICTDSLRQSQRQTLIGQSCKSPCSKFVVWVRIFKLLRSPGIYSKELIRPAYVLVTWGAGR